ncbi:mucin-7-like isoform X2 [Falco naumanni]|uniref:mucin-7-like isoform X2 n=1 Tax=Falco naumanni TaxID=148594 RepID=UPI001ADE3B3C|nr:mucin-7-like isoform X2 [Falco naumanni]
MARQGGGLLLPLLLLSLAVLHLMLGTTVTDVTATVSLTLPTSLTPMETSPLLPTTDSTAAATLPPSSPETGASTLQRSSTSLGTGSTSPPTMPPPTGPAPTAASAEPLTTLADTMATPAISTGVPGSNPTPSRPAGTTSRNTFDTSSHTVGLTSGTEPSSPTTSSTQIPEVTPSTPADLSVMTSSCPTATSNTSASHLFLSLRLMVPQNLENTMVQELVLSKLRGNLLTTFPCAGLAVEWRGKRRT